jgi:hypothetical protein
MPLKIVALLVTNPINVFFAFKGLGSYQCGQPNPFQTNPTQPSEAARIKLRPDDENTSALASGPAPRNR